MRPALRAALLAACLPSTALAGAFVFVNDSRPNLIAHPRGYTGAAAAGELPTLSVCLDRSLNPALVAQAEASVIKAVNTYNRFIPLRDNHRALGAASDLAGGQQDFESTLLHEMGHCVGLAHPNHANESGLGGDAANGTRSLRGPNGVFDQGAGPDGRHGSSDDVRGDDINVYWFVAGQNDPGLLPGVVDITTLSRDLADLPPGHAFAANGDRNVLADLGYPASESVMQQGSFAGEAQRHLAHEDVRALRLSRAGVDRIQGTADDYTWRMQYVGQLDNPSSADCNLRIRFDSTAFAACSISGIVRASGDAIRADLTTANLGFSQSANWYFSPGENTVLTLTPASANAVLNQPLGVQVTLREADGINLTGEPRGRVLVSDDAPAPDTATCAIDLAGTPNEVGSCQLTPATPGARTLTAQFLGFGGWDASRDSRMLMVSAAAAAPTTTSIIGVTPSPSEVGMPYSVTVLVQSATPTPAGTVQVSDGAGAACTTPALSGGTASCMLSSTVVGTRTLTAAYDGNSTHAASIGQVQHAVWPGSGASIFEDGFESPP